jgi:hypothetical protein
LLLSVPRDDPFYHLDPNGGFRSETAVARRFGSETAKNL